MWKGILIYDKHIIKRDYYEDYGVFGRLRTKTITINVKI